MRVRKMTNECASREVLPRHDQQQQNSVALLDCRKVSEKCHLHLISGNFHVVLPDFLVFLKFYSNVLTET